MVTILLRTLIIYVILICAMRLMGKRQIGELEVSDLVTTLLLSEIATLPIENHDIPVMYAVIPIITLLTIEVLSSILVKVSPKLDKILNPKPSILICRGKVNANELTRSRISIDELVSVVRQTGISDISEVQYAILEVGGKVTVIPKAKYRQPTLNDLNIEVKENGIAHIVISEGKLNKFNLDFLGVNDKWLQKTLDENKVALEDVFLMTVDDTLKVTIIKYERTIQK